MNTRKLRKAILTLCSALLLVSLSVGITVAYLTSTPGEVTNTFTAGNVTITLDEAEVDEYGVAVSPASRVTKNEYKLIPNHTYTKDPTVHVDDESEDCWLFVKIENGLKGNEGTTTIESQMAGKWTVIDADNNIYAYNEIVTAGQDIVVFSTFTLSEDADVNALKAESIVIYAYAVQEDTFSTAQAAFAAAGAPNGWIAPAPDAGV